MFCPSCGSEERQASQYCRACGTDLRPVRLSLEHPDSITASAASAREDIGRAVAHQIRQVEDARELKKVAEDVLPQIEKFLESPEEKRLRRMRVGTIISTIGVGATIAMLIMSLAAQNGGDKEGFMIASGLGVVTFFIGLGFLLNAFFFTRPRTIVSDRSAEAQAQNAIDAGHNQAQLRSPTTSNLAPPAGSVTEHTTLHLRSDR
jgi:hypothetical protein